MPMSFLELDGAVEKKTLCSSAEVSRLVGTMDDGVRTNVMQARVRRLRRCLAEVFIPRAGLAVHAHSHVACGMWTPL